MFPLYAFYVENVCPEYSESKERPSKAQKTMPVPGVLRETRPFAPNMGWAVTLPLLLGSQTGEAPY